MESAVRLSLRAKRDLEALYSYITRDQPTEEAQAAHRWYFGLRDAIRSLAFLPRRGSRVLARPGHRQLLYGTLPNVYRIIYRVEKGLVYVVHIRHGTRRGSGLP